LVSCQCRGAAGVHPQDEEKIFVSELCISFLKQLFVRPRKVRVGLAAHVIATELPVADVTDGSAVRRASSVSQLRAGRREPALSGASTSWSAMYRRADVLAAGDYPSMSVTSLTG
jgi:hypothetical protein